MTKKGHAREKQDGQECRTVLYLNLYCIVHIKCLILGVWGLVLNKTTTLYKAVGSGGDEWGGGG